MLFTHCYEHIFNLAASVLFDIFATVYETRKCQNETPDQTKFGTLQKQIESDTCFMLALCPTTWTVRGDDLISFIDNCTELIDFWDCSLQDTSAISRVQGFKAVMGTF